MSYTPHSPYYITPDDKGYLGMMVNRSIPKHADDIYFTISKTYERRPDLLAHDLYGDGRLWWVFAQRNPNTIADPMNDFVEGTKIYLPKLSTLKKELGL